MFGTTIDLGPTICLGAKAAFEQFYFKMIKTHSFYFLFGASCVTQYFFGSTIMKKNNLTELQKA